MTGMKMFKLWMVVMLLGLLPVVSEAQEDINNAINVQLIRLSFMVDNCLRWVIMNGITMAL